MRTSHSILPLLISSCLCFFSRLSFSESAKCGTLELYTRLKNEGSLTASARERSASARVAASEKIPARTLKTDNFLIHYTFDGVHAVKGLPEDAALIKTLDSVKTSLSLDFSGTELIEETYKQLDRLQAGHPLFVRKHGEYFEMAHEYYVETLAMREPEAESGSRVFRKPAEKGKFHIEIVNIASADREQMGIKTYALTYPPGFGGGIIMENDYLYSVSQTELAPLFSEYRGISPPQIINYALEWEKGIKVTAVHEYYHAVQYAYTPSPSELHVWYEMSAVAMEERLAPKVNDYLQYLPSFYGKHASWQLLNPCYNCIETYGSSVFHTYLTRELGIDFDVLVWNNLKANNNIEKALKHVFSKSSVIMGELYPRFTQPLLFSQREQNPFSASIFSEDLPQWPKLRPVSLRMDSLGSLDFALKPLTFEAIQLKGNSNLFRKQIDIAGGNALTVTAIYNGQVLQKKITEATHSFLLDIPESPEKENYALFSNASWTETAEIKITGITLVEDSIIAAFPNPYQLNDNFHNLLFTKKHQADSLTTVKLFSEYGAPVKTLHFSKHSDNWSWNLKTENQEVISPGFYYYQAGNQPLKSVLFVKGEAN